MRREGFELQVSRPEVILKKIDGVVNEPFEDLQIDVPDQYVGNVMDLVGKRGAELLNMNSENGLTRLNYIIPSQRFNFLQQYLHDSHFWIWNYQSLI